jgi:phage gp45-like
VEVFSGVGFYSRPKAGSKPEVIVVNVGGEDGHPVVVATRDLSIQVSLAEDETAIFNSSAVVKVAANGDVLVRAKSGGSVSVDAGGTAEAVAFWKGIEDLKTIFGDWVVVPNDGGQALKTLLDSWSPTGTGVLKAE